MVGARRAVARWEGTSVVDGLEQREPGTAVNRGQPGTVPYRTVILVNKNISISSNIAIIQRAVRVLYSNPCQGLYILT
jgi:hypothetical protein